MVKEITLSTANPSAAAINPQVGQPVSRMQSFIIFYLTSSETNIKIRRTIGDRIQVSGAGKFWSLSIVIERSAWARDFFLDTILPGFLTN